MSYHEATQALERCLLDRRLVGSNQYVVSSSTLEPDGRRRKALIRRLLKEGMMTAHEQGMLDAFDPTDKVLTGLTPDVVDFKAKWEEGRRDREVRYYARDRWFIRFEELSYAERLGILDLAGEMGVRFYVVDGTPLNYSASHYADEPGIQEDRGSCEWHGPFATLDQAQEQRSKCYARSSGMRCGYEIVFDTEELEAHIDEACFEERFQEYYPKLFAWALVKCGILSEDEAYETYQQGDETKKRPLVTVADGHGLIIGNRANVSAKPDQWQADVTKGIDRLIDQIAQAQAKLELYRKIEKGLAAYVGGFAQFLEDYKGHLRTALQQEDNEAEAA